MSGKKNLSFHATDAAVSDSGKNWLQLIPAGEFSGRDGRGPYNSGDKAAMEKIIAITLEVAGTSEIVVDYDHQSVFGAVPGTGGQAPAAGWIKQFEVRDDGIWGRVEWTAKAKEAILGKEYRYLSPVFHHTDTGRVMEIVMVSLTNTPNLELEEISAFSRFSTTEQDNEMEKIIAALGLAQGGGETEALAAINSMLSNGAAITAASGMAKDAKHEDVLKAVTSAFSSQKEIAKAVGASENSDGAAVLVAVNTAMTAKADGNPDPSKFVPMAQFTALSETVGEIQSANKDEKAEEAVTAAMTAGKIIPATKDWAMSYAKSDLKGFETFVEKAPVVVNTQDAKPGKRGDAANDGDAVAIAAKATTYQAEQSELGITISTADAVAFVMKKEK